MAFFLLQLSKRGKADQPQYRRRIAEVCQALTESLNLFWHKNPAFFYALCFLLGCALRLSFHPLYVIVFICVGLSTLFCKESRKAFLTRFICGAVLSTAAYFATNQTQLDQKIQTQGYFKINSLSPYASPFKKGVVYKGTFHFKNEAEMQTIPCSIYWYAEKNRPKADCDYVIEGTLFPTQNGAILRPHFHKEWTPQLSTFSLAELRFSCKSAIRRFFEKNLHSQEAASFLNALITGDLFERSLKFSFQQIGLSHVLVISGFHFAFITALAAFMLRLFLPFSKVLWCLFVIVNAYFFFLGSTPSIQRAWMVIQLYLLSKILGKKTSGTQLLGFALLIELILDPLMAKNIGLQLSFLSCLGILLLFTPIDNFLSRFLLKRSLLQVKELNFSSQMGFILGSFFRKSIALSLAVNASLLPVLLWHFHKFPLLGLVYNLFFPFLVMLNMALMIITLLLYPLFPFSLKVLDHFTSLLLTLTSSPPASLQYNLYCKSFPLSWLILYLTVLFLTAICFSRKERSIL